MNTQVATASRDDIRGGIFASKNKKPESRTITMFGQQVDVRQPNLKQLNQLSKAGDDKNTLPIVNMMIEYCYVPGTNDKVFDKADAEQLAEMPTGKWLTEFTEAISQMSGVDVKEAEKNSDETD